MPSLGESTVNSWVQRERRGKLEADAIGGSVGVFSDAEPDFIRAMLVARPDHTLRQVQATFRGEYPRYHPTSTFHRTIRHKLGFSKKGGLWFLPSGSAKAS